MVTNANVMTSSTLVETVNINFESFSDDFLTCATCLMVFDQDTRRAKLLPCSHSVCLSCLLQLSSLTKNEVVAIKCPLCREEARPPQGGVAAFPPSFIINQLLDVMQRQRREVVPSCSFHPQEQLSYCECCDLVFCKNCRSSDVNKKCTQHTVIPFAIALKRMSEIALYNARSRISALEQALCTVNDEIQQLDQNESCIVEQINSTFKEVCNLVENRRRELIESVRARRDEKRKVLKDQIENIDDEKKKLSKELEQCQMDIKSIAKLKNLDSGLSDHLCQPRENAFLRLNTDSSQLICDVQRCLNEFGTISASTTFPGLCEILSDEHAEVHTESRLYVKTFDLHGCARTSGCDPLVVQMKDADGNEIGVEIKDENNGIYQLIFRVAKAGDYILNVDIFGRSVKNSPYNVHVSSHHYPRWKLDIETFRPARVAIDSKGLFYVLDTGNNRIRVAKENGEIVCEVKSKCLAENAALGMVLLPTGELVVANWKSRALTKINLNGEEIVSADFSELKKPIDIALGSRGRYLIADEDKVFVFDTAFRPIFSFPSVYKEKVMAVHAGLDDDILIATKKGVLLYDGAGRFKRDIELAPKGYKGRVVPSACGVCPETGVVVCGIADVRSNKAFLSVSSYKGDFQFWLDSKGSHLQSPCGIFMGSGTMSGQCYVVDHAGNSVKMYKFR